MLISDKVDLDKKPTNMEAIHASTDLDEPTSYQNALQTLKNYEQMIDLYTGHLSTCKTQGLNQYSIEEIKKLEGKLIRMFSRQISVKQRAAQKSYGTFDSYPSLDKWLKVVGIDDTQSQKLIKGNYTVEKLIEVNKTGDLHNCFCSSDREHVQILSCALRNLASFLASMPSDGDITIYSWSNFPTSAEDVFVNDESTQPFHSKLPPKNGTLNSEGTSRNGSESSSNSHMGVAAGVSGHVTSSGGRHVSETDQSSDNNPGDYHPHHHARILRPKTPSSSSGPQPPSPSYASSSESDTFFNPMRGSSPPSNTSSKTNIAPYQQGRSPQIPPRSNLKLRVPNINKSKSTEDNSTKTSMSNEGRSNSSQSIDTAVDRKKKKKRPNKVPSKIPNPAGPPLHIPWGGEATTNNDSPFCTTPGQGGKFFFNDSDSKQPGSGSSGKSSKPFFTMKKVGQLIGQIFTKKKGTSDDTESVHDEVGSSSSSSHHRNQRERFPSTPTSSTTPHRHSTSRHPPDIKSACSSSTLDRKRYPDGRSCASSAQESPATPRGTVFHPDGSNALLDLLRSGNNNPSVTDDESSVNGIGDPPTSTDLTDTLTPADVAPSVAVNGGTITTSDSMSSTLTSSTSTLTSSATEKSSVVSKKPTSSQIRNIFRDASNMNDEWEVDFKELALGEVIGRGRVGTMYKGRWHGDVAIRVIDISLGDEEKLRAFKQEVNIYKKTRHENIELYMASCINPPSLAIVTGYCKDSLSYLIRTKSPHWANKKTIVAQHIAQGMGYLHSKKIIHRDLKSKNVFYDGKNFVITDFGLMGLRAVCGDNAGIRKGTLELPKGWLPYLAPEIVRALRFPRHHTDDVILSLPYTFQSDVYAFGTLWYEIYTGGLPFDGKPVEYVIFQVGCEMKYNFMQVIGGKDVKELLMWCWSPDPLKRPDFSLEGIQGALKKQLPHQLQRVTSYNLHHKSGVGRSTGAASSSRSDGLFKKELPELSIPAFKPLMEK